MSERPQPETETGPLKPADWMIANPAPARTFNLHARFNPDGIDVEGWRVFLEFWVAAMDCALKGQRKKLAGEKRRLARLMNANRKAKSLLLKALRNEISVEAAATVVKRRVPDAGMRRELLDYWEKLVKRTPEQTVIEKEDIKRREAEMAQSEPIHKATRAIMDGLSTLGEAATAGDVEATKSLADTATWAAMLLLMVEMAHPEPVRCVARESAHWPVLATEEAGWEREAVRRVAELQLGADMGFIRVRFRQARGTDANLPARQWAKGAVRTVEQTRWRFLFFRKLVDSFGSERRLADFCVEKRWRPGEQPRWVNEVAALGPFSVATFSAWKGVIRHMIRQEMPAFHERPEWINQRNTAARNGRETKGEVQNAILDDIVSALARLAPPEDC